MQASTDIKNAKHRYRKWKPSTFNV